MDADEVISSIGFDSKEAFEETFGPIQLSEEEDVIERLTEHVKERYETYSSFLESLVQPDSSMSQMTESSVISDDLRMSAYELYKRMMRLVRTSLQVGLHPDEHARKTYLKTLASEWKAIAKELATYVDAALSVWTVETDMASQEKYFG